MPLLRILRATKRKRPDRNASKATSFLQPAPQVTRALHELLVFVLLHLQLTLALDADGVHGAGRGSRRVAGFLPPHS